MLILTRKPGESIQIGDAVELKVIAVSGDQVKIGIEAPREIDVNRGEIYEAIRNENSSAVSKRLPDELLSAMKSMKTGKQHGSGKE